jgi:hypothetical protein
MRQNIKAALRPGHVSRPGATGHIAQCVRRRKARRGLPRFLYRPENVGPHPFLIGAGTPGHGYGKMRSSLRPVSFTSMNTEPRPHRLMSRSISSISTGGGTAGLEQPQECLLGAHRHPLGDQGLAIRGHVVDAPAVAVHVVHQDAQGAAV